MRPVRDSAGSSELSPSPRPLFSDAFELSRVTFLIDFYDSHSPSGDLPTAACTDNLLSPSVTLPQILLITGF